MFNKIAAYKIESVEPIYIPTLPDYMINQNIKVAGNALTMATEEIQAATEHAAEFDRDSDNTRFDLEAEIQKHPNSLYVKCFAIKADEENDNGDYFSQIELKKATPTFYRCSYIYQSCK